ncbi:MAG: GIY-YIG nuclease family protein, partial [Planctomycetes bacterium]|nr:GIY-YIG nuclease family protein [Planctomycetota bacterium]
MDTPELLAKAKALPHEPGCYVMKDGAGKEIYIGKAKDLRRRVTSYFQPRDRAPKDIALIENIADFEYIVTESEIEAVLLESRMIKDLRPKYNFMLKNNELYPYIEVTMGEDFPRVLVTRRQQTGQSRYFGPFRSASELRVVLGILGRIFRFRVCNLKIREHDKKRRFARPCLNFHIGLCLAPCTLKVSKETYRKQIAKLLLFFSGKKKDLIKEIQREMEAAAGAFHFEEASLLRDSVTALENINNAPAL